VSQETPDPLHVPLGELKGQPHEDELKPTWRGWIHTGVLPFVVVAGIVLVIFAEGWVAKSAAGVYFASAVLLFGNSAFYHRLNWKPFAKTLLKRIDHANIFLLIAGTYTPISASGLVAEKGTILLILVWSIALVGIGFRVFWINAPRWLYVPMYLGLGWIASLYVVDLFAASWLMMTLVIVGGLFYTVGAIIYALKRPNPSPKHFGFHEIFHALTVAAFFCHFVAALLIGFDPIPGSLGQVS
jgi:hemolysin III